MQGISHASPSTGRRVHYHPRTRKRNSVSSSKANPKAAVLQKQAVEDQEAPVLRIEDMDRVVAINYKRRYPHQLSGTVTCSTKASTKLPGRIEDVHHRTV